MLYTEVIKSDTLKLLKVLMKDENMNGFNLVGGTALSLYLGHRRSIDLDLFSYDPFNERDLQTYLTNKYDFIERFKEKQTLKGNINGVFIDCIQYNYPMISPVNIYDDIRITSIPDIIAMKLAAITNSGDREKDFVDIAFFSTKFSLNQMLNFQTQKFKGSSPYSTIKALIYFNDIKRSEPLMLTDGIYSWNNIEKRLYEMEKNPNQIFNSVPVSYNPEEVKLKNKTVHYAIAYIQGTKGFPWLRDAFNELCDAAAQFNNIEQKEIKNYRQFVADRLTALCSPYLNEQQKKSLYETLKRLSQNNLDRSIRR